MMSFKFITKASRGLEIKAAHCGALRGKTHSKAVIKSWIDNKAATNLIKTGKEDKWE